MAITTVWESKVYSDDIDKSSLFSFINNNILYRFFEKYSTFNDHFGRPPYYNARLAEILVMDILPNELRIPTKHLQLRELYNIPDALAFCMTGGLKNKVLKSEMLQQIDVEYELHKNLPGILEHYAPPFESYLNDLIGFLPNYGMPEKYLTVGQQLFSTECIPVVNSPLSAESLENLLKKATPIGLGAYIGYLIVEPSPLMIITMPVGMIIFGGASGLASGLEYGLRQKIIDYLVGKPTKRKAQGKDKQN